MSEYDNPVQSEFFNELSKVEVRISYDGLEEDLYNGYTEDSIADYLLFLGSLDEKFKRSVLDYYLSTLSNPERYPALRKILGNLDKELESIFDYLSLRLDIEKVNYTFQEIKKLKRIKLFKSKERQNECLYFFSEITEHQYSTVNHLRNWINNLIIEIPDIKMNLLEFNVNEVKDVVKDLGNKKIETLDIRQSGCLFYLLREYKLINQYSNTSLAKLVWLLTGHSEQNLRTKTLSSSEFDKILSGESRADSKKTAENINRQTLLKYLDIIVKKIKSYDK